MQEFFFPRHDGFPGSPASPPPGEFVFPMLEGLRIEAERLFACYAGGDWREGGDAVEHTRAFVHVNT